MRWIKAICFGFGFALCPLLMANDLIHQSINSGGGWSSNSQNSSFIVIGESHQSAQLNGTEEDSDDEKPVIALIGDRQVIHEAGSIYVDANASWSDNVDGEGIVIGIGEVNSFLPGIYTIVYDYTDQAGNQAGQVTRTVTVVDTTAPVITLIGEAKQTHEVGSGYIDLGAVWNDLVDGNGTVDGFGTVDVNVPGVYEITYSYVDSSGNHADPLIRTVTVVGNMTPVSTFILPNQDLDLIALDQFMREKNARYIKEGESEVLYREQVWDVSRDRRSDKYQTFDGVVQSYSSMTYSEINAVDPYGYNDLLHSTVQGPFSLDTEIVHDDRTLSTEMKQDENISIEGVSYPTKVFQIKEIIGFYGIDAVAYYEERSRVLWVNETLGLLKWTEENTLYSELYSLGDSTNPHIDEFFTYRLIVENNRAPTNLLSVGPLSVQENQPVGTFVGEFNATDLDGDEVTFHLVSGQGDGYDPLLILGQDGILKTATVFDYENNATSYSIRVQARDESNASVEGDFTVTLLDLYEPTYPNHLAELNSTVSMDMIWVEPGTFMMGSPETEVWREEDETQHQVTLTKGFYLGKYEVTQAQYEAVMTGNYEGLSSTPSHFAGYPDRPVEQVSWDDIQIFLNRLNEQQADQIPAGWAYVLPTEAQWEYACRAGTITAYSWGDSVTSDDANYNNTIGQTTDVGSYSTNAWGFFDMHGNVDEWTVDLYSTFDSVAVFDPQINSTLQFLSLSTDLQNWALLTGANYYGSSVEMTSGPRVLRGGSWGDSLLRSANRLPANLSTRTSFIGFRVGFQQVEHADTVSPELELFGETDITHELGEPWAEPGFAASDQRDGNLTSSVTISGTVDVSKAGSYVLTYSVVNSQGNAANDIRSVQVIDPLIEFESTAPMSVLENQPIGAFVGEFNATPPNGLPVSFVLVNGDGDGNNSLFTIDQDGVLRTAEKFVFEDGNTLSIRVQARDELNAKGEGIFKIIVVKAEDKNRPPTDLISLNDLIVEENNQLGVLVGKFNAKDPDGDELLFSLGSGDGDVDNELFLMSADGELTISGVLDFEEAETRSIRVQATDPEGASVSKSFIISVLDDPEGEIGLDAFNWEIPETLRFGEPIGNEFFSARGSGKAKFEYDLNGERITKASRPIFEPGEISMQARLLREGVERNATTHTLTGLKGRPYLKIVFEQNQTELKLIPELFGLHPDHSSDPSKALELNDKITLETSQKRGLENLDKGRLRIESSFSGILHASAFFPGDVHYEEATARISLQVKQGKVNKLGREGMVTIQVKDLDGWQENHLVNEGQELIIVATQGFGKNRKFKQWVEFSEDVQKLRTARVQTPFSLRTALIADEDMTLFARYNYTFVGTAINGYISGAKVFLDLNLNGKHDEGEPSSSSMKNGGFEIEMEEDEMQMHDKNQNGKLDPSEAMIVVMGGFDQSSKLPLKISYKSPPGYKVITSISTLIAEFLKGEFTESEAEKMVSQYISLPNDINFSEFEPLRDVFSEGEKARDFVLRSTQLSNLLNEGSRFLKLKSGNQVGRVKASQFIIKALRDRIIEESLDPDNTSSRRSSHSSDSLDLNDPSVLLSVINSADEDLASSDESDAADELSESTLRGDLTSTQPEIAEAGNDEILNEIVLQIASANVSLEELANDPNLSPEEFKSLASASQSILDELGELTSNTIFEEELEDLSNLTGEDAVSAASIIDQSVEVQSLPDSSGPPTLDSNSLRFFSLEVLKETSSQNQTNVYAPVLTDTTIFAPEDFSDDLVMGNFLAYDPEGADVIYSIVGQNPDHDLDGTPMLSIDSSSGEIKVLDFDDLKLMTEDTVSLIFRLSDPDGLFRDDEITLNIASWTYFAGRLQIPKLSLSVPENMPVGTTIHTFEKEDAHGGLIQYQLVRGTGDTNNESFSIDSDGNLKTSKVFDYESDNTAQMIRLQAIDSQFNFVEESLTIQVSDLLLPNIQTGDATIVDSKLHFDATVTSFGDFTEDFEFGFYMSRDSITDLNDGTVLRVSSSFNTDTTFTAQTTANFDGGSYHFIAFAQSAEVIKLGAEKTFMLPRITASEDWTDGQRVAGYEYWWASDWFGLYNTMYYPWIYHQNLGWIYIHAENEKGAWMYHKNLGWNWTIPDVFPHIYVSKAKLWSYVSTESPQTKLYDYQLRQWFRADVPIEITGENFLINGGEVTGYGNYYRWDRVVLEAKPKSGFNFAGWSGGLNSMDSLVEFQAVKNMHIDASFLSIRANDLPSQEMVKNIQEVLGRMSHLSKAEKDKSLAELLINGTSPTSGLSIKKN